MMIALSLFVNITLRLFIVQSDVSGITFDDVLKFIMMLYDSDLFNIEIIKTFLLVLSKQNKSFLCDLRHDKNGGNVGVRFRSFVIC